MLRTNLSTRPFYNERLVRLAIIALALVAVALTVFNVTRVLVLTTTNSDVAQRIDQAERRATELRREAARVRAQIDRREMQAVATAAREANQLIDRRTFSWTELFNRFEATLPPDARISDVRPKIERDGSLSVTVVVIARRVEDLDRFIENLEATGAFRNVLAREESTTSDGLIRAVLEGQYAAAAAEPPPSSDAGGTRDD